MHNRPQVLIACSERVRKCYLPPEELARLEGLCRLDMVPLRGRRHLRYQHGPRDHRATGGRIGRGGRPRRLPRRAQDRRRDIGCSARAAVRRRTGGRPFLAARLDLDALWERGIRTVDTTNGSTYPVAEWALGADADLHAQRRRALPAHHRRQYAGPEGSFSPWRAS